jgi:hypothetical protein
MESELLEGVRPYPNAMPPACKKQLMWGGPAVRENTHRSKTEPE